MICCVDVPAAPIVGVTNISNNSVTLSILEPCYTGGLPIRNYSITTSPGRIIVLPNPSAKTVEQPITDLMPKTMYTFSVRAVTAIGVGPAAVASITTFGIILYCNSFVEFWVRL